MGELCYNFSISNDLTKMVNFPNRIPLIVTGLLFWICFFLLTLVLVLQWLSLYWEILIVLLSQFALTFNYIHNRMLRFIALLMTILVLIGMVFVIISEMFYGRTSLNSVLLLPVNFVSGFRLELMYKSLIKIQLLVLLR